MLIKGNKQVQKLSGLETVEVEGVAIPLQMRVYFENPMSFEGQLTWIVGAITETGEVFPSENKTIELNDIKDLVFKNGLTGDNLLEMVRELFLINITPEPVQGE